MTRPLSLSDDDLRVVHAAVDRWLAHGGVELRARAVAMIAKATGLDARPPLPPDFYDVLAEHGQAYADLRDAIGAGEGVPAVRGRYDASVARLRAFFAPPVVAPHAEPQVAEHALEDSAEELGFWSALTRYGHACAAFARDAGPAAGAHVRGCYQAMRAFDPGDGASGTGRSAVVVRDDERGEG